MPEHYFFQLVIEEAFPVLLSIFLLSLSSYSWFLYLVTKNRNMLLISIVNIVHLVKSVAIFSLFGMDIIPNGERVAYFEWGVLSIDVVINIVSSAFLIKIFKFNTEAKYSLIILGVLYLTIIGIFSKHNLFQSSNFHWVPFVLSCLSYGLVIVKVFPLNYIETPDIRLIVLDKFLVVLFILASLGATIDYAFFKNYYLGNYLVLFSYISLFSFTISLVDLIKLDYEDKISDVEEEKKIFSTLTHYIGKELIETDDVVKIIKLINQAASQTTQSLSSIVWMLDDDRYKCVAMHGNYPPLFKCKPYILERSDRITKKVWTDKFKPGETYAGYVAEVKRAIFLTNLILEPNELIEQTTNGLLDIDEIITVPIILEKKCIGVLSVVNKDVFNGSFTSADLSMLKTLADQVAIAYSQFKLQKENLDKRINERDLSIAEEIQSDLLPGKFLVSKSIDFYGFSFAAKGVGGDYFDFIKYSDQKFGFIISDVAGKGIPASLVMVMIRSVFKVTANETKDPHEVVEIINNTISLDVAEGRYATFFYYMLDIKKQEIVYSNAANQPLLIYRAKTGDFEELDSEGTPLGIMLGAKYEQKTSKISTGDILVLYTDGITEAMNTKRYQYGMERLQELIKVNRAKKAEEICKLVHADINKFVGEAPQHDDQTLFISKIL